MGVEDNWRVVLGVTRHAAAAAAAAVASALAGSRPREQADPDETSTGARKLPSTNESECCKLRSSSYFGSCAGATGGLCSSSSCLCSSGSCTSCSDFLAS